MGELLIRKNALTKRQSRYANEGRPRGTVNPETLQSGPTRGVKQRVVFAAVLTLQDGRIKMATVATGGETIVLMERLMLMHGQPMNWSFMIFLRNIAVAAEEQMELVLVSPTPATS